MDRLYRNNGDGTFTDVTKAAGIDAAFGNGLGNVAADFNGDGLADLFVANDGTTNQLWMNAGNLRFEEECVLWSCAMDSDGIEKAGMGVASADVDDDGDSDLLVVNLERQTDSYFRNEGSYFFDATRARGPRHGEHAPHPVRRSARRFRQRRAPRPLRGERQDRLVGTCRR